MSLRRIIVHGLGKVADEKVQQQLDSAVEMARALDERLASIGADQKLTADGRRQVALEAVAVTRAAIGDLGLERAVDRAEKRATEAQNNLTARFGECDAKIRATESVEPLVAWLIASSPIDRQTQVRSAIDVADCATLRAWVSLPVAMRGENEDLDRDANEILRSVTCPKEYAAASAANEHCRNLKKACGLIDIAFDRLAVNPEDRARPSDAEDRLRELLT